MSIIDDLWKYEFKSAMGQPDVSIIVPAFGQAEVTANCLIAISRTLNFCETSAEVILMDDASEQDLSEVFQHIRGLKIFRNETNLGFLKTCNRAVSLASGKDIVLLNNDTIPTGRWLDHLFTFRTTHPNALVVGARLVSSDGRLQESGGIIFKDGSGWNFGRGWDWDDPRCTYPREVDYCSGAAILIEGRFARAMGPFDERFIPAYYEDTDLCFEARSHGGSVWVEPRAVVIHLEGVSYGRDTEQQLKPYQAKNSIVFTEKWINELSDQFPNGEMFTWRARSRHSKQRIVFIDNEVPQFDNNSGALRTTAILKLMIEAGYEVSFVPVNGLRQEPYTSHLESFGIEVLGPLELHKDYLCRIEETIKQIWVSRVSVATKALPFLEPILNNVPLVFDTVDIHHVRLEREEVLTNSFGKSQQIKRQEIEICNQSKRVIVVSEQERKYLASLTDTPISVLSNVHEIATSKRIPPQNQRAVFVGSFQHTPNIDAVHWFVEEVLPLVIKKVPKFEFWVIGDKPPISLTSLIVPSLSVLGWVENLDEVLENARLNIAPLRYGAGVKGKISHALSIGLPTVTTSIGAEGMNLTNSKDIEIADTPEEMVEKICLLLQNDRHWENISIAGKQSAEKIFGFEHARTELAKILT
jgi:GT2 family glycosyltransferase/glycosyltransferase involved in cell wall biosynthesis